MLEKLLKLTEETDEGETFKHLLPDVYGKTGTTQEPFLYGLHPTQKNHLACTAVCDGLVKEYTVFVRSQRGAKTYWNKDGYLNMICTEKYKASKCPAKMLLKCPSLDHHNPDHPLFFDYDNKYNKAF